MIFKETYRWLWIRLLFLVTSFAFAQNYAGIQIDNDLYFGIDRYYSSGIFLKYGGSISKNKENTPSVFRSRHWTLGQEINTPSFRYTSDPDKIDFPYNGWLFIERLEETFRQPDFGYGWAVQLGTTGAKETFAKWMQNTYHIYVLKLDPLSWAWALPQAFHLNARVNLKWGKEIQGPLKWVQEYQAQAGTYRTYLSTRMGIQLGSLAGLPFFGERLEALSDGSSLFLGTRFIYNIYDYSLSGNLQTNELPMDIEANSLRQEFQVGMVFIKRPWKGQFLFHSSSNYVRSQRYPRHPYLNLSVIRILP